MLRLSGEFYKPTLVKTPDSDNNYLKQSDIKGLYSKEQEAFLKDSEENLDLCYLCVKQHTINNELYNQFMP